MTSLQKLQTYAPEGIVPLEPQQVADILQFTDKTRYRKTALEWDLLERANKPINSTNVTSLISDQAKKILGIIVRKLLKEDEVFLNHRYLFKITKKQNRQNLNLIKQLSDIFDIKYERNYIKNNKKYGNGYLFKNKKVNSGERKYITTQKNPEPLIHKGYSAPLKYNSSKRTRSNAHARGSNFSNNSDLTIAPPDTNNSIEASVEKIAPVEDAIPKPTTKAIAQKLIKFPQNQRKKPTKAQKTASLYKFRQYAKAKTLSEIEPITPAECSKIQRLSGREFNLNAMNEILKDMAKRRADYGNIFYSRTQFLAYFSKCMKYEKRQAMQVNNLNFKITASMTEAEIVSYTSLTDRDKYLNETESRAYTHRSDENQYRAKLVGTMKPWQAFNFLSNLVNINKVDATLELHIAKHVELTPHSLKTILKEANAVGGYEGVNELEFVL